MRLLLGKLKIYLLCDREQGLIQTKEEEKLTFLKNLLAFTALRKMPHSAA